MISRKRWRPLSLASVLIGWLSLLLLLLPSSFAIDENSTTSQPKNDNQSPALLVLLVDSLRWDAPQLYTVRSNRSLPGFTRLASDGAFVDEIRPVFPAECFPNIFSLFSGLYPADHGAIFNDLYNETDNATYSFHNWTGDENLPNLGIEKLFNADLTMNKRIQLFNLPPGCSHPVYAGVSCEEVPVDNHSHRLRQTLDKALIGLQNESADMAVVYFDELDRVGHRHGPLSDELLLHTLPKLDRAISDLMTRLDTSPRPVNLLVTSDHGMTDVKSVEYLDRIISPILVKKVINRGSTVSIWPLPDQYQKVHFRLTERSPGIFTVYNRTNLPTDWRTGGPFFPPILLVNQPGVFTVSQHWPFSTEPKPKGLHGYVADLPDMRVPLFIYGPSVRSGFQITTALNRQPVDHLDTHVLINHMLGLYPTSGTNGVVLNSVLFGPPDCCNGEGPDTTHHIEIVVIFIIAAIFLATIVSGALVLVCVCFTQTSISSSHSINDISEKLIQPDDTLPA